MTFLNQLLCTLFITLSPFDSSLSRNVFNLRLPVDIAMARITFDFFLFFSLFPCLQIWYMFMAENSNNTEQKEEKANVSPTLLSVTAVTSTGVFWRTWMPCGTVGDGQGCILTPPLISSVTLKKLPISLALQN